MATVISEAALREAATDMEALQKRNDALKSKLETMFINLTNALDTPSGHAIEFTGKDVVVQPIDDMGKVIKLMSSMLNSIIGQSGNGGGTPGGPNSGGSYFDKLFKEYDTIDDIMKNKKGSV